MLIASLLHHAFVMAGNGLLLHADDGLAHAVLHLEQSSHHHHDDGSVHEDDSDQSKRHVQADSALGEVALPLFHVTPDRAPVHRARLPLGSTEPADFYLSGTTRPPRLTA
jgi:hypothetical protein